MHRPTSPTTWTRLIEAVYLKYGHLGVENLDVDSD